MIKIYTDGSTKYNGKPYAVGGYGYVMVLNDGSLVEKGKGIKANTSQPVTNNRAELIAIIEALKDISNYTEYNGHLVEVHSDSIWAVNCGNGKWKRKKNKDLWRMFDNALRLCDSSGMIVSLKWIKGHNGHKYNEMADDIAESFYN